jgi:hypothetical protein
MPWCGTRASAVPGPVQNPDQCRTRGQCAVARLRLSVRCG